MKKQYLFIKLLTLLVSITANAQFVNSGQNLANKSRDVLMLDVDNDNDLDLIFGKSDNTAGSDRNVVWLNDGNGNYSFSQAITTNTLNNIERTFDIDAADINNDNFPEFYSANAEGGLLNENSNGVFSQSGATYPGQLSCVFLDYDDDSDMDLLATDEPDGSSPNYDVYRYRNNGGLLLRFGTPVISLPDDIITIKSGDMDNDGDDDIVLMTRDNGLNIGQSSQNYVYYYRSEGNGSFTQVSNIPVVFLSRNLELFDIDNDNDLDIIYIFNDPNSTNGNSKIRVYKNSGSAVFTFYSDFGSSSVQVKNRDVAFGDLDGDGDADAFVANAGGDAQNRVWYNDGNGNFTIAFTGLGTSQSDSVELGDIDGDGDLDAVTANWDSAGNQQSQVWINNLIGTNTAPTTLGTIPNISQVENSTTNQTIDLTQYFADSEDGAAGLTYTVTTTDPSYFSTNISGTDLLINFNSGFGGPNTVTIQAEDSGGLTITQSFTVTVTQQQCTVPTNVSVSNISFFDADISWTGSADAADGYQWYVMSQGEVPNQGGVTPVVSGSIPGGTTTASVTGLNFSTDYDVYVEALCSVTSTSSLSSVASFTTLTCQSPSNLATSNITDSSVTATWTASPTAFNGYNWYVMNPGEAPGADTPIQNGVEVSNTVAISSLNPNTSYDLYIQSRCATGFGSALNVFVNFTTTNTSCSAPTNVATSNINASSLDLAWTASADAINGYRWYIVPGGQGIGSAIETNVTTGTTVNVNASNLVAGNSYDAYVVSRCSLAPPINSGLSVVHTFSLPNPDVFIAATPTTINENIGTYDLVITTNVISPQDITVQIALSGTSDSNDYSISSLTAVIPAGNNGVIIPVTIIDDSTVESDETLIFDITSVTNGNEANGFQQLTVTIVDNDTTSTLLNFTNSGQNLATFASDVVLGDFDTNPGLDVLLSKFNASDRMFANDGSGILSNTLQSIGAGNQTNGIVIGDFDLGTQKDDVYLAKQSQPGEVWTNDGSGLYVSALSSLGQSIIVAEAYDIDGDSADDLVLVSNADIKVYLNDVLNTFPNPSFPTVEQTITETDITDIKIGFINNDTFPDLVLARDGENKVYFGDVSGDFVNPVGFGDNDNSRGVDLVDLNNDGLDDIVFANETTNFGEENKIYLSNGTSFLSVNTPQTLDDSYDVAFADFDNDGDNDIVFANQSANVIWEATPTGYQEVLSLGNAPSLGVDVGDIDGDGDIDIIFANNDSIGSQIWFNNPQTLSDNDFEVSENMKLYPNPVKDVFTIAIQNNDILKVEIFNLQGQLVKTFKPSESYDIRGLDSGLYFVNIKTQSGLETIKIIKE